MDVREKLVELFYENNVRCEQKIEGLVDDVMDIIAELDKAHGELFIEYHKMKKQRDAAIAWLPKTCGYCKHYNGLTCNNKDCRNINGVNTGWEWRGAQE